MTRKQRQPRIVHVLCADAAGYRWFKRSLTTAVGIETADGFEVRDEARFADALRAAGGREVP